MGLVHRQRRARGEAPIRGIGEGNGAHNRQQVSWRGVMALGYNAFVTLLVALVAIRAADWRD